MTALQQVRVLLFDKGSAVWQDEDVQCYLDLSSGSVLSAAALALRSLAADRARLLKVVQDENQELQRFSPKEILELAESYESRASAGGSSIVLESGSGTFAGACPVEGATCCVAIP